MKLRSRVLPVLAALILWGASTPAAASSSIELDPTRLGPGWTLVTDFEDPGVSITYENGVIIVTPTPGKPLPDIWVRRTLAWVEPGEAVVYPEGSPFEGEPFGYPLEPSFLRDLVNPDYLDVTSIPWGSDTGFALQPRLTSNTLPIDNGIPFQRGSIDPYTPALINILQWAEDIAGIPITEQDRQRYNAWVESKPPIGGELVLNMRLKWDSAKGKWTTDRWTYRFRPFLEAALHCLKAGECGDPDPVQPTASTSLICHSPIYVWQSASCTGTVQVSGSQPPQDVKAVWLKSGGSLSGMSGSGLTYHALFMAPSPGKYTVTFGADVVVGGETITATPSSYEIEVWGETHTLSLFCDSPVKPNQGSHCTATPTSDPPMNQRIRWSKSGGTLTNSMTTGGNGQPHTNLFRASSPGKYIIWAEMLDSHGNVVASRSAVVEVKQDDQVPECTGNLPCEDITPDSNPVRRRADGSLTNISGSISARILPPFPGTVRENASPISAEVQFRVSPREGPRAIEWQSTPLNGDVPIVEEMIYTSRVRIYVTLYDTEGNPIASHAESRDLTPYDAGKTLQIRMDNVFVHEKPGTAYVAVKVEEERTRRWRRDNGYVQSPWYWEDEYQCWSEWDEAQGDWTKQCGWVPVRKYDYYRQIWISRWTHPSLMTGGYSEPWQEEPLRTHNGTLLYDVTGTGSSLR